MSGLHQPARTLSLQHFLGGNFGALDHSSPVDLQYNEDHQESEIQ